MNYDDLHLGKTVCMIKVARADSYRNMKSEIERTSHLYQLIVFFAKVLATFKSAFIVVGIYEKMLKRNIFNTKCLSIFSKRELIYVTSFLLHAVVSELK